MPKPVLKIENVSYHGASPSRIADLRFKLEDGENHAKLLEYFQSLITPNAETSTIRNPRRRRSNNLIELGGITFRFHDLSDQNEITLSVESSNKFALDLLSFAALSRVLVPLRSHFKFPLDPIKTSLGASLPGVVKSMDILKTPIQKHPSPYTTLRLFVIALTGFVFILSALLGFGPTSKLLQLFVDTTIGNIILTGFATFLAYVAFFYSPKGENLARVLARTEVKFLGALASITAILGLGSLTGSSLATQYLFPSALLTIGYYFGNMLWQKGSDLISHRNDKSGLLKIIEKFEGTLRDWEADESWNLHIADPIEKLEARDAAAQIEAEQEAARDAAIEAANALGAAGIQALIQGTSVAAVDIKTESMSSGGTPSPRLEITIQHSEANKLNEATQIINYLLSLDTKTRPNAFNPQTGNLIFQLDSGYNNTGADFPAFIRSTFLTLKALGIVKSGAESDALVAQALEKGQAAGVYDPAQHAAATAATGSGLGNQFPAHSEVTVEEHGVGEEGSGGPRTPLLRDTGGRSPSPTRTTPVE